VSERHSVARVLIADAQTSSREGIRLALEGHGFTVCATAAAAEAAVESAHRERPDACLIDVSLPGGGVAAAERIAMQAPGAAIVMLSGAPGHDELLDCLHLGARGYLPKDMDPARLPVTLRGVLAGESAIPRGLVGGILEELHARERGRHATELSRLGVDLTLRERQVLELLDAGLGTAEMAEHLGLSGVTVRRHVSGILGKLNVPDREGALRALRAARERT
jgi:DNA-binding NarL/FixJ family response regulator